ncbi:MAG: hypothetical protein IAE82_04315 [Opitutaceae bacterium]|nr:hypothetical protein [Opitutaceae bacterium]
MRIADDISALRDELALRSAAASPGPARVALAGRPASPAPPNPWPNAGRREPLATFQTVQWAIHEADLDALVNLLAFDDEAFAAAVDFFDRLDPESREEFGSPQRLIAAAVAAKSRTGIERADLVATTTSPEGPVSARLRVSGSQVKAREITLHFEPSADGWRLRVPAKVVTGYRNLLLGPVVDPYTHEFIR